MPSEMPVILTTLSSQMDPPLRIRVMVEVLVVYDSGSIEIDKIKWPDGAKANSTNSEGTALIIALRWLSSHKSIKVTIILHS